jgi:hypothetical protein
LVLLQEDYFSFYEKFKDLNLDELILEDMDSTSHNGLLNRLYALIKKHIELYKPAEDDFRNLNISNISKFVTNWYFQNQIDRLNYDNHIIKTNFYPAENERQVLLEENRLELIEVLKENNKYTNNINIWFYSNYYDKIYELSNSFLAILNYYLPTEEESKKQYVATKIDKGITYFKSEVVSKIYELCNDEQFTNMSELDFINNINLRSCSIQLQIKDRQIKRVIYLINKLHKICTKENKAQWLEDIQINLRINKNTFKSNRIISHENLTNRKLIEFIKNIDQIF